MDSINITPISTNKNLKSNITNNKPEENINSYDSETDSNHVSKSQMVPAAIVIATLGSTELKNTSQLKMSESETLSISEKRKLVTENDVELIPLNDTNKFIKDVQIAFQKDYEDVFGPWNQTVIPTEDVNRSLNAPGAENFFIKIDGKIVGGTSLSINKDTNINEVNLLYVNPEWQNTGIGKKAWETIEAKYPDTKVWELFTPHYSVRNINFYMNTLGFTIKNFYNKHHQLPGVIDNPGNMGEAGWNFFEFEKVMKPDS